MKIDLFVQRVARKQELLGSWKRLSVEAEGRHALGLGFIGCIRRLDCNLTHPHVLHQPIEIDCTCPRAGHQTVTPEIIEAVGIERAGNDRTINVLWVLSLEKRGDGLAKSASIPERLEQGTNISHRASNDIGGPFLVCFAQAAGFLHAFKSVAEWSMTDVVQQSRNDRHIGPPRVELLVDCRQLSLDNLDQRSGNVKHADRMGEAGVSGTWKDEFRHA
jgi:hypothetical protein